MGGGVGGKFNFMGGGLEANVIVWMPVLKKVPPPLFFAGITLKRKSS